MDTAARKKQVIKWVLATLGLVVLVPIVVKLVHHYIWNNLHFVNFAVAWIPACLSILVAFIPDKELEKRLRITWRTSVIGCGILYSVFLWHQQNLTDQTTVNQTRQAINKAITMANRHTDEKFNNANQHSDQKFQEVEKGLDSVGRGFDSALQTATGEIDTNLGKVGRPRDPTPAALIFSLWTPAASLDKPARSEYIVPDNDGNFPINFTIGDGSQASAKSIDIWVQVCPACSFAKEPVGFEHPTGGDDHIRHRRIGDLNPGMSFEEMTVLVKAPRSQSFQIGFRYSCEDCGGKMSKTQIATISEGTIEPAVFKLRTMPQ